MALSDWLIASFRWTRDRFSLSIFIYLIAIFIFFVVLFKTFLNLTHNTYSCIGTSGKKITKALIRGLWLKKHCRGYMIGYPVKSRLSLPLINTLPLTIKAKPDRLIRSSNSQYQTSKGLSDGCRHCVFLSSFSWIVIFILYLIWRSCLIRYNSKILSQPY